ncbi:hypothetical protein KC19_VG332400 [Ceratodon purpureus]|uniref:Uncharacterized protein n=1 Tax=Ceratodon purpureus TaxID=3225 RepID=A0A8T0HXT4_CERPU|nr:hypothetical protein KC19_VG332400 [Ceratodon purpureus]
MIFVFSLISFYSLLSLITISDFLSSHFNWIPCKSTISIPVSPIKSLDFLNSISKEGVKLVGQSRYQAPLVK